MLSTNGREFKKVWAVPVNSPFFMKKVLANREMDIWATWIKVSRSTFYSVDKSTMVKTQEKRGDGFITYRDIDKNGLGDEWHKKKDKYYYVNIHKNKNGHTFILPVI